MPQSSLPTHFCLTVWGAIPPDFFFSFLFCYFFFFPSRSIETNPSKKRKRANKMMKRHWQQSGGGRESVGVNARMRKRESLPFENRKELINNPA